MALRAVLGTAADTPFGTARTSVDPSIQLLSIPLWQGRLELPGLLHQESAFHPGMPLTGEDETTAPGGLVATTKEQVAEMDVGHGVRCHQVPGRRTKV